MTEPETKMPADLDEALLWLQADPPRLFKDKKGQAGNQPTKYADLNQVNDKVLKRLNEYGVIYKCKPTLNSEGKFVLAYTLKHLASGTADGGEFPIPTNENSQRVGSAISYARRYALLAVTGVAAEDDDDDGRATDGRGTAQRAAAKRATPEQQAQVAQRRPSGPPLSTEGPGITQPQMAKMQALLGEQGYEKPDDRREFIVGVIGRDLDSMRNLTKAEAKQVIDRLEKREDPAAQAGASS